MKRKDYFNSLPSGPLLVIGLLTVPAFLFQDDIMFRILETLIFIILCRLSGKKIRILPGFLLLFSVTVASLLIPMGKVLFSILGWRITAGALESGLSRGFLLLGLLYVSKFFVRPGTIFPGTFGEGLAKVFVYFEKFSEYENRVSVRDLAGSLDSILLSVSAEPDGCEAKTARVYFSNRLLFIPVTISGLCWILLFI